MNITVRSESTFSVSQTVRVAVGPDFQAPQSTEVTINNWSTFATTTFSRSGNNATVTSAFRSGFSGTVTLRIRFFATITYRDMFGNTRTINVSSMNDSFITVGLFPATANQFSFGSVTGTVQSVNITHASVMGASGTVFG